MTRNGVMRRAGQAGFTLIELLVVVAIIALLISILLPSLSKARSQARGTLCASRIGQLAKAMLVYSDDFAETPPFLGRGWEDCGDTARLDSERVPGTQGHTLGEWASWEEWLMPNPRTYWLLEEKDWPISAAVRNGTLFPYARFEALYRCPEFERIVEGTKSQNVFNYTRTVIGRKWFHKKELEGNYPSEWVTTPESDNWCGIGGPIVKTGQVYAASQLHMVFDEQWNRHCAAPPDPDRRAGNGLLLKNQITEVWMEIDPIFGATGDEIGRYHGTAMRFQFVPPEIQDQITPVKRGNAAFYDGHVALEVDPLPDRKVEAETAVLIGPFFDWLMGHMFAQRGIAPDPDLFENPLGG